MADVIWKPHEALAFDGEARRVVRLQYVELIRDQLRLIWNARGVADIATVESQLFKIMKPLTSGAPHAIDRAIRALGGT